jgi:hypothetical protein
MCTRGAPTVLMGYNFRFQISFQISFLLLTHTQTSSFIHTPATHSNTQLQQLIAVFPRRAISGHARWCTRMPAHREGTAQHPRSSVSYLLGSSPISPSHLTPFRLQRTRLINPPTARHPHQHPTTLIRAQLMPPPLRWPFARAIGEISLPPREIIGTLSLSLSLRLSLAAPCSSQLIISQQTHMCRAVYLQVQATRSWRSGMRKAKRRTPSAQGKLDRQTLLVLL